MNKWPMERDCVVCGAQFVVTLAHVRTKKTCSQKCRYQVSSQALSKPRIEKVCAQCGETFSVQPCNKRIKFCSTSCYGLSLTRYKQQRLPLVFPVWNKGLRTGPNPEHSARMMGRIPWNKGRPADKPPAFQFPKGHTPWNKGKPFPQVAGENNINWKGGVTPINRQIRTSAEYKFWRSTVFKRDDYTCQSCGERGGNLHADHIKPFCQFPDLRLDPDNGRTLCKGCHGKIGWQLFKDANPRKHREP